MTNLKSEPSPNESFFGSPTDDITDFHFDDFDTESSAGKMRKPKKTSGGGRSGNRENHNRVERARRETLNGRFMALSDALPSMVGVKRPSKSIIVNRALDFVFHAQVKEHALITENNDLRQQVDHLRARLGLSPLPPPAPLPEVTRSPSNLVASPAPTHQSYCSTAAASDLFPIGSPEHLSDVESLLASHQDRHPIPLPQLSSTNYATTSSPPSVVLSSHSYHPTPGLQESPSDAQQYHLHLERHQQQQEQQQRQQQHQELEQFQRNQYRLFAAAPPQHHDPYSEQGGLGSEMLATNWNTASGLGGMGLLGIEGGSTLDQYSFLSQMS